MFNNGNGKREKRKIVPFVTPNLFNVDRSTVEGRRKYNTLYQRFYRLVWEEEKYHRKCNGMKAGEKVVLPESTLKDILKKVTLTSLVCLCIYQLSFYTTVFLCALG